MNFLILLTNKEFLDYVSKGFIKSFEQIYLTIIGIISFIIIIILISKISKFKEKKELKIILDKKYNSLIKKYEINSNEKEIIERLSKYLRNPEKKYLLLLNPNVYHCTLNKLRELIIRSKKQHLDDKILYSLERKLGFNTISQYSELNTTFDLPDGMSVYVIINENQKEYGKIINTEKSLNVKLKNGIKDIFKGQKILIYTHNFSGIYAFYTKLNKIENDILSFAHTKDIKTLQRRSFFRKRVNLPIIIEKTGETKEPVETILYDISGGGASIDNAKLGLKPHDDIQISFPNNNILTLHLNAEVIRCSRNGKIIHVKFNHIKSSVQDRIIRLVNK